MEQSKNRDRTTISGTVVERTRRGTQRGTARKYLLGCHHGIERWRNVCEMRPRQPETGAQVPQTDWTPSPGI